jgi:hypothetical protein
MTEKLRLFREIRVQNVSKLDFEKAMLRYPLCLAGMAVFLYACLENGNV